METWLITLIIALPLGFIIGNIMLLKHTAKMQMKKPSDINNEDSEIKSSPDINSKQSQ